MRKRQLIIAEDDALIVDDMKGRLESLGYEVSRTTPYAQEAVLLVQGLKPDLVLMDIQLPGEMDGIEAAEQIRPLHVPVVYVTGYCDGPILERAKLTEPYGYIIKPYQTRDLKAAIELGLYKHRAERDRDRLVQDALAKVKALSGLLSICAYCKKIKDDEGYWGEIENYIMRHSNASFTHGMCPDCFARLKKQLDELQENGGGVGSIVLG